MDNEGAILLRQELYDVYLDADNRDDYEDFDAWLDAFYETLAKTMIAKLNEIYLKEE